MVEREKVIEGLKICYFPVAKCQDCAYHGLENCNDALCRDAYELLKEQEPTRPVFNGRYWECEQCKERYKDILAVKEYKHCPGCGRRIEWN